MTSTLKTSIEAQRAQLGDMLGSALSELVWRIEPLMRDPDRLDHFLRGAFLSLDYCKYVYVLDAAGKQVSSTINRFGADPEARGRDRSHRPYMLHMRDPSIDFNLSDAYISRNKKRPSLTAVQTIRDSGGERVGYLGVDYDLRELPHSDMIYEEPSQWRQIKGDPAIRSGLFAQQRSESAMDRSIDVVMSVHEALILDHGVHHFQVHFSSSRTTIWHRDDPYVYRILTNDELIDPDICLAYPRRPYFERAIIPPADIKKVLQQFKALRFADETIYLRSGSLNIVNGTVGLNFSCDGSHYLSYDEFLSKGLGFWFGEFGVTAAVPACAEVCVDNDRLDAELEDIAKSGCVQVNKLLNAIENGEVPARVAAFSAAERDYIYRELRLVMDVYEGGACGR